MPTMGQQIHDAAVKAPVRQLTMVNGATHPPEGQPASLDEALDHIAGFVAAHIGVQDVVTS